MTDQSLSDRVAFYDLLPEGEDFGDALRAGLSQTPKTLPCKFLYDQKGSRLFDQICELDEYYVTRTENDILIHNAPEIAEHIGGNCHLIEFGSGSSIKVEILLRALWGIVAYTGIDISKEHLLASTAALAKKYPHLPVSAVCADYTRPFDLPSEIIEHDGVPVVFFPGSSIGNFTADQAGEFFAQAAEILRPKQGAMLIGADLKKDEAILRAAYNDARGITAAFNLNLLVRANTDLGANFDISAFHHHAVYNDGLGRIEMYLISDRQQSVIIGTETFSFADGDTIHTENSHKYGVEQFQSMAQSAGFEPVKVWIDEQNLFSIHFLRMI
ncbi:L-histidine N(alpha)-methyltransferase [Alphaproteobacteria bacterium]|nr:L-histidine N(alpha)-methyltransferase [Alphaproteobacteria bacterium]